jgi:hypothetical protein
MNFVCPIDVGTGDIHQQEGRVAMAEAAERESCLFLSEWEAARRANHAIRRKYTEGQLLGYATAWEGIVCSAVMTLYVFCLAELSCF